MRRWKLMLVACGVALIGCKSREPKATPTPEVTAPIAAPVTFADRLKADTGVAWDVVQAVDRSIVLAPLSPLPAPGATRAVVVKDFVARYRRELGIEAAQYELVPMADDSGSPDLVILVERVGGVIVDGCELRVRFADNGAIAMVFGRLLAIVEVATAGVTADFAVVQGTTALAQKHEGIDATWFASPPIAELAYWAPAAEAARLIYRITFVGRDGVAFDASEVRVDAALGDVLEVVESEHHVRTTVEGKTAWRAAVRIELEQRDAKLGFWRPAQTMPADARCKTPTIRPELEVRDAHQGFGILRGELVVASLDEVDAQFGDLGRGMAVDAYVHLDRVSEYFRTVFCRSSWDGVGGKIIALVDGNTWGAFRAWQRAFTFDRGTAEWLPGSATLEIVGHEYVHGIISSVRRRMFGHSIEEAALEEGVGDAFGQLIEAHYGTSYGARPNNPDLMGESAGRAGKAFRSLVNPAEFADAMNMRDFKAAADPHVNSGIVAHAFWRMIRGPRSEKLTTEAAQHVWYNALGNWSAGITFAGFAYQTIVAARGRNAPLAPVACAWVDVGVLFASDVARWATCEPAAPLTILGHWDWTLGDWGTVSFVQKEPLLDAAQKVRGYRVRGAYTYRDGTIALECDVTLRKCTGEWFEAWRGCATQGDHGTASFEVTNTGAVDGSWRHLGASPLRDNWDLKRSAITAIPEVDLTRLADDAQFRCR